MATYENLQHGILLIQHRRFPEAEQEIRQELAQAPENAYAHALLAAALTAQDKTNEAIDEAQRSVGLAPTSAYSYFILAMVLHHAERDKEALPAIQEAIRIDPEEAQYYEMLGKIFAAMEEWTSALEAARAGLALDPQDVGCANLEAMALVLLGRRGEASAVIETALQREPENAVTHANLGWADLHAGKHEEALVHFREALRLNPNLEWARRGIIEAMKARSIFYRPLLRYFLWMSRLPGTARWGLVIGLWFVIRFIEAAAKEDPSIAGITQPIIWLYMLFAFMSWIAIPLFNLFLRLDKVGRNALSKEEILASNWLGLCVFGGLGLLIASFFVRLGVLGTAGIGLLAMAIPVAGVFRANGRKGRIILTIYTAALALIGLGAVVNGLTDPEAGATLSALFILGWVAYTWIANVVISMN